MQRLTNRQVYEHAQLVWDKSNSPHQTARDFQSIYEAARVAWLRLKAKDFEVTEALRSDLRNLIRDHDFGNVQRVNLGDAPDDIQFITGVHADFEFVCNGKTEVYTRPIKPLAHDQDVMTDPFNQPDDEFPMYLERNDGQVYLDIYSTNTPMAVTLYYIKVPKPFNLISDPNGLTEEDGDQQIEIINMAVRDHEMIVENYNKFQAISQTMQSNGG